MIFDEPCEHVGKKAKLKKGAVYFQDFSGWEWTSNQSPVFTVVGKVNGSLRCEAIGYGMDGHYGNGKIYVKEDQIKFLKN